MKQIFQILLLSLLCVQLSSGQGGSMCQNNADCRDGCNDRPLADFVFVIDCSSSMQANIDAVRIGMPTFVDQIAAKKTDARFAVVLFALEPEVILDWTASGERARTVLKQVIAGNGNNFSREPKDLVHFDHDCKHTNRCGTREPALEAIRMVLGKAPNSVFSRHPMSRTATNYGEGLTFRNGAEKYVFLVTDEDSDCPFHDQNRFFDGMTQQCTTPGFKSSDNDGTYQPTKTIRSNGGWPELPNPWQKEVEATAQAVIDTNAHLSAFVRPTSGRSTPQFGDPTFNSQVMNADFSDFNGTETLAKLIDNGWGKSLQARILSRDVNADVRLFDTRDITSPNVVDNFFTEVTKTIVAVCFGRKRDISEVPEPNFFSAMHEHRKRQGQGCQVNYCSESLKACRADPLCDGMGIDCDNCKISNLAGGDLCIFDGLRNPDNACEVCNFYQNPTSWSNACDDRDDCTIDECVMVNGKNKCKHTDDCRAQCGKCLIDGECVSSGVVNPNNECEMCDPLLGEPTTESCAAGNVTVCSSYYWWSPIVPAPMNTDCGTKMDLCPAADRGKLNCNCLDGDCTDPGDGTLLECDAAEDKCVLKTPAPTTVPQQTLACPEGSANCPCTAAGECDVPAILYCVKSANDPVGKCQICQGCNDAGKLGKACRTDNHPDITTLGECDAGLVCVGNTCSEPTAPPTPAPTCVPGTLDCECDANKECPMAEAGQDLKCNEASNKCKEITCTRGELGCDCTEDEEKCDGQLQCDAETKICRRCKTKELGCACAGNGQCNEGLSCHGNMCIDTCTFNEPQKCCEPGKEGCICKNGDCEGDLTCSIYEICDGRDPVDADPCNKACKLERATCEFGAKSCTCGPQGVSVECKAKPAPTPDPTTEEEIITGANQVVLAVIVIVLSVAIML